MKIASTQYSLNEKALEIYLSGCDGSCIGCHNPELKDYNIGTDFEEMLDKIFGKIIESDGLIDKIWILGGEPLLQNIQEFEELVAYLKQFKKELWLFTRFDFDKVKEITISWKYFDYIKCGEYIESERTDDNIQYGIKLSTKNQYIIKI